MYNLQLALHTCGSVSTAPPYLWFQPTLDCVDAVAFTIEKYPHVSGRGVPTSVVQGATAVWFKSYVNLRL